MDGRLGDSRGASFFTIGDLDRELLRLGPHHVHPHQHLGPVTGLGAAGPGVDGDKRVAVVVGTAQHRPQLEGLQVGLGPLAALSDLLVEVVAAVFLGQLDRGRQVIGLPDDILEGFEHRVERLHLSDDALGLLLVVPERGALHLAVECVAAGLLFAQVKESLVNGGYGRSPLGPYGSNRHPRRNAPCATLCFSCWPRCGQVRYTLFLIRPEGPRWEPAQSREQGRGHTLSSTGSQPHPGQAMPDSAPDPALPIIGRLAPSPTGGLHLGHARTFLIAWLAARHTGGKVILRIEDLDTTRVRAEAAATTITDLQWLGLDWDEGPFVQSQRGEFYAQALNRLMAARTGLSLHLHAGRDRTGRQRTACRGRRPDLSGNLLATASRRRPRSGRSPFRLAVPGARRGGSLE